MSWKDKVVGLYRRFGAPAKFAAKLVLGAFVPGGSAVVELVGQALDCVDETAKDNLEIDESRLPAATAADLKRVEEMLDVLGGYLAGLTEQVAALERLPEAATKILDIALRTDDRCRAALHKIDALAQAFDALAKQHEELLRIQGCTPSLAEALLPLMRRTAGAADFVEDLCAGGPTADEFRSALADFREGASMLTRGRVGGANSRLDKVARSWPTSAAAAVALAAALAANRDLSGAQKSVARAARLRPRDAGLAELSQRLMRVPAPPPRPDATPRPQRPAGTLAANALGMKFAWIPPGRFRMGSPPDEPQRRDDETEHWVTLTKGFWLGIHTVTQAQWAAVMHDNPSRFEGDDLPVEQIAWRDAVAYCRALGKRDGRTYRLPTEAEWEYACRAGTTTTFHFGDTISTDQANYDGTHSYPGGKRGLCRKETTPGGSFPSNRWMLFDMHGNVREWCQDWYAGFHPSEEITDPQGGESGGFRVLRGGSWRDHAADCRAAARHPRGPAIRDDNVGCRVVLDME